MLFRSLALQRRYRLIWDSVPYEAGELKVVTAHASTAIRTAGKPHHIELIEELLPQDDLHFVRVRIVDKNGELCPTADNLVQFSTKGSGHFVAAANGDATNLDLFHEPKHHAFSGELTVIIEGDCTLSATAKGLKGAKLEIQKQ